jgi:HAD superfamily hydrolase (TIGR01456 family)
MRASDPIPKARETLLDLQSRRIPFILLTNGGGKHEKQRVAELSSRLEVDLDLKMFIQSHSPFAELDHFKDKTVLVIGGDGDTCRKVAESYGYRTVVTPGDILLAHPEIWPFSAPYADYYKAYARQLPKPIISQTPADSLKIDAVFVYNDPRDWGLDAQLIMDLALSRDGIFGTLSDKNGNIELPNNGYQQDGQPPLYFSNPDLWWAAKFNLPRIGQGAFRESVEGIWAATTGGPTKGSELLKIHIGKPHALTYRFGEKKLLASAAADSIKRVYMIGDNPGMSCFFKVLF